MAASVYTGIWRNFNYEYGPEISSNLVLTVPRHLGALLLAFMALFVSLAMSHLWGILCLVLHQSRWTRSPSSGLYHQQQALLSNVPSTSFTAWTLFKLAWTWRTRADRALWTSAPLIFTATFYVCLAYTAGLLSSKLQLSSDEVLADSGKCGFTNLDIKVLWNDPRRYDVPEEQKLELQGFQSAWARWIGYRCLEYVHNCYTAEGPVNDGMCNVYTTPSISFSTDNQVPCPFSPEICGQSTGVQVDTGYVDSNTHLGINTRKKDRIRFRKLFTCAPLDLEEKFSSEWNSTAPQGTAQAEVPGDAYKYYFLGESRGGLAGGPVVNYTWLASKYALWNIDGARQSYSLGAATSPSGHHGDPNVSQFTPIPELRVPNADINVLYLFNDARYTQPVEDPWFRATQNTDQTGAERSNDPNLFLSDQAASSLGCTEQYQFCNTTTCTDLGGLYDDSDVPYRGLILTETQQAIYNLTIWIAESTTLYMGVTFLGAHQLRANEMLWFGDARSISSPLPPTQWEKEVSNFGSLTLAMLQRLVFDFASPADFFVLAEDGGAVSSLDSVKGPETDGEKAICERVRIRDPSYDNFTAVGVGVVLLLGFIVIIFDIFCLPGAFFWARRKLGKPVHAREEWNDGNLFMLQRSAFEGKGIGPWQVGKGAGIPWTRAMSFPLEDQARLEEQNSEAKKDEENVAHVENKGPSMTL